MTFKKRSHAPLDGQITACRRNSCAKVSRRVWCIKKLKEKQCGYTTVSKGEVWDMKKKKKKDYYLKENKEG